MRYRHIYGPVLSRRLGRSLGVDVIPYKTCTYDCVYCLLGRTTRHTAEMAEHVPGDVILDELSRKLAEDRPDAVSFAGSGEPTLNSALGEVIRGLKRLTPVPVAVFTNSSLLWRPEVRANLAQADIVSPSLDAVLPDTAARVNRLAPGLDLPTILEGLRAFCLEYRGRIWLEILLAAGYNDSPEDVDAFAGAVAGLKNVERVQLNTVVRPPAEKQVAALGRGRLEEIAARLPGRVEIIAPVSAGGQRQGTERQVSDGEVYDLVERHPSTLDGVAAGLGIDAGQARRIVERLLGSGVIGAERRGGETFYVARNPG